MHTAIETIAFLAFLAAVATAAGEPAGEPVEATPAFTEVYNNADQDGQILAEVTTLLGGRTEGVRHYGKDCWKGCRHKQGKCGWCGSGMCCRLGWRDHSRGCNGKMGIRGRGHVCIHSPKPKVSKHVKKAKKFMKKLKAKVLKGLKRASKATIKKTHKKRSALAKALAKTSQSKMAGRKKSRKKPSAKKKAKAFVAHLEGRVDDQEDRRYHRKNSRGVNRLLGNRKYHSKFNSKGQMHPPGYVTGDTSTGPAGHYYLGPSRRRIGAGFGRRRRTKVFPKKVLRKAKKQLRKRRITSGYKRIKKSLKYSFSRSTKKITRKPKKKKPKKKKKKKKVAKKKKKVVYKRYAFGSMKGVTFYKHCVSDKRYRHGYRKTLTKNTNKVSRVGLKNDDVSAISAPPGWCARIYEHTNYRGASLLVKGPRNISCLVRNKLGRGNWNDKISSIKVWYCARKPKKKNRLCQTTTIRYTTGTVPHAKTGMRPKVALMGSKRAVVATLRPANPGRTGVTTVKTEGLGRIKSLRLLATGRDGWYFTSFSTQFCRKGSKRVYYGCDHRWLDGKPYDKTPYNAPYGEKITLKRGARGPCEHHRPKAVVQVVTGEVPHSASNTRPKITLYGSKGRYTGRIKLPMKGVPKSTKFILKKDLGSIKKVKLQATGRDGWMFTRLAVQTNGRWTQFGCSYRWLDGKPYDKTPYHQPYSNRMVLHPVRKTCKASFPKRWKKTNRGCFCSNTGKQGRCAKYGSKSKWCRTRDKCGKYSHKGNWDWCK